MGPKICPETSVTNYQSWLHNISEERPSILLRGGSLMSPRKQTFYKQMLLIREEIKLLILQIFINFVLYIGWNWVKIFSYILNNILHLTGILI
jgi:hypothetical protein